MKSKIVSIIESIRSSYWFIPAVMALGAIALSAVGVWLDRSFAVKLFEKIPWLFANRPDGARAVLSTIAGSMITVAGVTFSITIVSVSQTAAQFGPRILTNFMRDRGNQVTLGTFVATFLYCLLVLRTVRSAEEVPPGSTISQAELIAQFVPHLSVAGGLVLALCSIAVLIYFVHHVPQSIHISNVTARIGEELGRDLSKLFPSSIGFEMEDEELLKQELEAVGALIKERDGRDIHSGSRGYLQHLDSDALIKQAREHDLVVRLRKRPGEFLDESEPVLTVWSRDGREVPEDNGLSDIVVSGAQRTPSQDTLFLVDELVEIAVRALSPGMNDPFTAMTCLDWVGAAIGNLVSLRDRSSYRFDEEGRLRVLSEPISFGEVLERSFGQLRPYAARDRNVSLKMLDTLRLIGERCDGNCDSRRIESLKTHAFNLLAAVEESGLGTGSTDEIRMRYRATVHSIGKNGERIGNSPHDICA